MLLSVWFVLIPQTTKLIVKDFHEKGNLASGTNQTLAALSVRYWILSGREAIREWKKRNAQNVAEEERNLVNKLWLHYHFQIENISQSLHKDSR